MRFDFIVFPCIFNESFLVGLESRTHIMILMTHFCHLSSLFLFFFSPPFYCNSVYAWFSALFLFLDSSELYVLGVGSFTESVSGTYLFQLIFWKHRVNWDSWNSFLFFFNPEWQKQTQYKNVTSLKQYFWRALITSSSWTQLSALHCSDLNSFFFP